MWRAARLVKRGGICWSLVVAASGGAGFEQVEQAAMLEQQLLTAERQCAFARRTIGAEADDLDY